MIETKTALYSPLDIAYNNAMSGPYQNLSVNLQDVEIIAGVKDGKVSGFWRPVVAFGDTIPFIKDWDIVSYLDFYEDGKLSKTASYLLEKGYRQEPVLVRVIDLAEWKWKDIRKSYKSLINGFEYESSEFKTFEDRHRQIKGERRPQETFNIQWLMTVEGSAYVVNGTKSSGLFYRNKDWAYYASGVDGGEGLHGVVYNGIYLAQQLGCKYFEMGELLDGDEKQKNISHFKQGFGGVTKTRMLITK